MHLRRIVIIGATSCIAERCAKQWLAENQNINLVLVARNVEKLKRSVKDKKVRHPKANIKYIVTDFLNPKAIEKTVTEILKLGKVDIVLIAQGALPDQSLCQNNSSYHSNNIQINAISPVLFAECFARSMEKENHGTIAIIGSVAGDRGKKSNYIYGSSKSLLETHCEGMQHRFYKTNVKIVLIKAGPTNTPMTASLKNHEKFTDPKKIASQIIKGIKNKEPIIYTPKIWRFIMLFIIHVPNKIFNKFDL